VAVPLRVVPPPLGPVTVPLWVQVPPEQLVLPLRVVVPRGPVNVPCELHEPPEQLPDPLELQELPRGPLPEPERDQPASALDTLVATSARARQAGARYVLNDATCISSSVAMLFPSTAQESVPGSLLACFQSGLERNDLYQAIDLGCRPPPRFSRLPA
jgi:hypothetical protein